MNLTDRRNAAAAAAKRGNWIIRFGDSPDPARATCHAGFKLNGLGEWTKAPDWNPKPECGGGLHGQDKDHGGYRHYSGQHLYYCDTEGEHVGLGDKAKVRRARLLLVDELPRGLVADTLDLSHCTFIKSLNAPQATTLYARGCTSLTEINAPQATWLDARGCPNLKRRAVRS